MAITELDLESNLHSPPAKGGLLPILKLKLDMINQIINDEQGPILKLSLKLDINQIWTYEKGSYYGKVLQNIVGLGRQNK